MVRALVGFPRIHGWFNVENENNHIVIVPEIVYAVCSTKESDTIVNHLLDT